MTRAAPLTIEAAVDPGNGPAPLAPLGEGLGTFLRRRFEPAPAVIDTFLPRLLQ